MYNITNISYFNNKVKNTYAYKNSIEVRYRIRAFIKSLEINLIKNFVCSSPLTYNFIVTIPFNQDNYKLIAKYIIEQNNIIIKDVLFYKL